MKSTNRRSFLGRGVGMAAAAATASVVSLADEGGPAALAFGNRAHMYALPNVKEKLTWCFTNILGCGNPVTLKAPGLSEPILAFKFPDGGSISVEFTGDALDEKQIRWGAWLEIWSNDSAALQKKVIDAGLPQVHYKATNTFYFVMPGGQVFGIVAARNPSAVNCGTAPR